MNSTEKGITLVVNGRKRTFSEEELTAIVEKHYSSVNNKKQDVKSPKEGFWFLVKPKSINRELFKEPRKDYKQEATRKLIIGAFDELEKNPSMYSKPFQTLIPKKTWCSISFSECQEMAFLLGDRMADWVEQALEWAQRICNGESWDEICNFSDKAQWYRLIVWKNGYPRMVGGSKEMASYSHASSVAAKDSDAIGKLYNVVPLIVRRKG